MIINCANAQFISKNTEEMVEFITTFKSVNEGYSNNLVLSLYNDTWEVHDMRANKVIFEFPFKKYKELTESLKHLERSMSIIGIHAHSSKRPDITLHHSIKYIVSIYGFDPYFLFTDKLINYAYGHSKEKNNY